MTSSRLPAICLALVVCLASSMQAGTLSRIYIVPQDVGLVTGAKQQFQVIGEDVDGNEVSTGTVTWAANATAGSVTSAGLFTAGSTAGKYSPAVTASVPGGLSATANVEVYSTAASNGYVLERSIGTSNGYCDSPMAISFDGSGNVYVVSQSANAINKLDSAGRYLAQFRLGYTLGAAAFLGVTSDGTMFVADPATYAIRKYGSSGTLLTQWGSSGTGNGQFQEVTGMAVDSTGQVYVADAVSERIQTFTSGGAFVRSLSSVGTSGARSPLGLMVDARDHLWAIYSYEFYEHPYACTVCEYDSQGVIVSQQTVDMLLQWRGVGGEVVASSLLFAVDSAKAFYTVMSNSFTKYTWGWGTHYEDVLFWGTFGQDNGKFDGPTCIAVNSAGQLCVTDTGNNRIQAFDSNGQFVSSWCSSGSAKGQFKSPSGIAVDSQGNIYVSDTGNHRVQEFSSNGGFVRELASKQQKDSVYACPGGLSIDAQDNLRVTDTISNRVLTFNSAGALASNWALPGSVDSTIPAPMGIARQPSGNSFYVVDSNRDYVQTLDSSGALLGTWLIAGTGNSQVQTPVGIAVESHGYAFVSDYGNNRVQKFNGGVYMTKWGTTGTGNGQFQGPAGLCVDSGDNVYVADTGNCRIQKFSSTGVYSKQLGSRGYGAFGMMSPEAVAVDSGGRIYVADTGNHRILKFVSSVLSVAITTPTDQTTYITNAATIDLGGTATGFPTSITWVSNRGGSGICTGLGPWSAPGIVLLPGVNTITVTAREASGASVTDALTVTCRAPNVTISSPTTLGSYMATAPTINLSGTASDDISVTSVSWSNSRGGGATCVGTTAWSANGITLQPGRNTLTVTASDAAGNAGVDSLIVIYPTTVPTTASELKTHPDGTDAYLVGKTITAAFADCFYIEEPNRTSALKVVPLVPITPFVVGTVVDVAGTLRTDANGERYLDGTAKVH